MALTAVMGAKVSQKRSNKTEIVVVKDEGTNLYRQTLEAKGVKLLPSADFATSRHPFDILVASLSVVYLT